MSRSLKPVLPRVVAFHAVLPVEREGRVLVLEVDRPDWAPDEVVMRETARSLGVGTVGEVVAHFESLGKVRDEGPVDGWYNQGNRRVWVLGAVV